MRNASGSDSSVPPRRPRGDGLPVWKKALFAILTCAFALAGLEGLLAVAGFQPTSHHEDPYVGFSSLVPLFVEEHEADGSTSLVTAQNKLRFFNAQRFPRRKSPGTRRVFCLGGSTTYGRPYNDQTSFCGWLREFLPAADPDTTWEVINAGGISYASYRVAIVMQELTRHQPDIFILYTGHNEFLEKRTYGGVQFKHPVLTQIGSLLSSTRVFSILKATVDALDLNAAGRRGQLTGEVHTLLDRSVGPSAYSRDDALRDKILEHYRFNLKRMILLAREAGAQILMVTPASNLKDSSPFKSENSEALSASELARWHKLFERALHLQAEGDLGGAERGLREVLAIDSRDAETHYRLGQVLHAAGRWREGHESFVRARDEDVCPLRALTSMQDIVRSVARSHSVRLIDFEEVVRTRTLREDGDPTAGATYFLDHVHPTIEGNRILALALLEGMMAEGIAVSSPSWGPDAIASVTRTVVGRVDEQMHGIALRNLAKVLSWAGKTEDAARLAKLAVQKLGGDAESLFIAGSHALDGGRLEQAVGQFRRALELEPEYVKAHTNLGIALGRLGEIDGALRHYDAAIHLEPAHANALYNRANLLSRRGDLAGAIEVYRTVLRLDPEDEDARFNLASALFRSGDYEAAAAEFRALVELNPSDVEARRRMAEALRKREEKGPAPREPEPS